MKKIWMFFTMLLLALSASVTSYAAGESAAAMAWVNPNAVSDVSATEKKLTDGLQNALKKYHFNFTDSVEAQMVLQQYMIENGIVPDDNKTSVGFLPKKTDLQAIAQELNVKYVVFTNARITDEKEKVAWFSLVGAKYEATTMFTTIVYSADEDRYVYFNQQSVKENAAGTSSSERAFNKCCDTYFTKKLTPDTFVLK